MKSVFKILPLTLTLALATGIVNSASLLKLVSRENEKWAEWKNLHTKLYADTYEENFRRAIWRYNLKKIEEHNKADRSFTMGLNKWSDLTPTEFRIFMLKKAHGPEKHVSTLPGVDTLPAEVDWRKKGCVTPVKDQGALSKSWAFSAVGSLEGQHCIVTKQLISLDVKKLEQCCTSCWSVVDGFQYMIEHNHAENLPVSSSNEVENENCNFSTAAYGASLTGFVELPSGSEAALERAVALIGPVSVIIDASLPSFQMYVEGVYDEPSCSSTQLDHAVLVVGYGTMSGNDYWLVKNSWGVNWGMKGYIMMSRNKDNQCGIATAAAYPTGVTFANINAAYTAL
ncbi:cathepsin L1-like [Paramuricea clavata]|uniref:Cathepsin L1-like n=1 Tax=Paramuricea clavata TaxID=317549 RepID=A0A7D9E6H8_PARCT|nr:cathepsin L1-like [Paramuricea clavata]